MKKIVAILLSLLLILTTNSIAIFSQDTATISTQTDVESIARGEEFSYDIYIAGTYDGFSLKVVNDANFQIKTITPATSVAGMRVNVDNLKEGEWTISVLPGCGQENSAKSLVATVTVIIKEDAALGDISLELARVQISSEAGDPVENLNYDYSSIAIVEGSNYVVSVSTETQVETVSRGAEFSYSIYIAGTYDGFSLKVVNNDTFLVKTITPATSVAGMRVNVDNLKEGEWTISVLPGCGQENAAKALVATVTVTVKEEAALGETTLKLAQTQISDESGDPIRDIETAYATISITEAENQYVLSGWEWAGNYSSATATFVNSADESDKVTVTDDSIGRILVEPTVDDTAYVFTYTASVEGPDGQTYTDQKVKNALFAGWYKDADYNECYTEAPADGDEKYAKWVDPLILGLQFQLKTNASVEDEKTVLRVLTSVDTLNFENVGFVVKYINGAGEEVVATFKSETVYKKVIGTTDLGVFDYEPTIFSLDSTRFCAFNLTIPQSLFDTTINYTAFWTTYDGTVVYGQSGDLTLSGHMS